MTLEIILLVMSIVLMLILWAGLKGIEVSGQLAVGLVSVAIGVIGLINFHEFDTRFGLSMGFLVVGGAIFFLGMKKNEAWKELAAAACVAGALVCGVYAILSF